MRAWGSNVSIGVSKVSKLFRRHVRGGDHKMDGSVFANSLQAAVKGRPSCSSNCAVVSRTFNFRVSRVFGDGGRWRLSWASPSVLRTLIGPKKGMSHTGDFGCPYWNIVGLPCLPS